MSRLEKVQAMLKENPDDIFLNYAIAMEFSKEDQIVLAQAAFKKVRKLDPNYVPAYFQEGQMLAQDDQIPEAQAILKEGIDVAKRTGDNHALGEMTEFLDTL